MTSGPVVGSAGWMRLALRRDVVGRAMRTSAVVGTILMLINHGDALIRGDVAAARALKIALTYCVPFAVATFASVQAIRSELRKARESQRP